MDVTHISSFGWQCYVHVSVDTYSGYLYASAHTGEVTKHVTAHCLAAFTTMGEDKHLKTNNGPAYTSTAFQCFCEAYQIQYTIGILYNPKGQVNMPLSKCNQKN
jgi:hypothetical protein